MTLSLDLSNYPNQSDAVVAIQNLGVPILAALLALFAAFIAARIAHSTKVSEFRQAWIDQLRHDISEYIGLAEKWFRKWEECSVPLPADKSHLEAQLFEVSSEAIVVLIRIKLRINPLDNKYKEEDDKLLADLDALMNPGKISPLDPHGSWHLMAAEAVTKARKVLKREWEVTKRSKVLRRP